MDEAIAELEIASISANESEALKSISDERKTYWEQLFAKYSAHDENVSDEEFAVEAEEDWTNVPSVEAPIPMPSKSFRKFVRQTTRHFDFQSQITVAAGNEEDMINDSFGESEDSDGNNGDDEEEEKVQQDDRQEEHESDDEEDVFHRAQSDTESVDQQDPPSHVAFSAFRDAIQSSPSPTPHKFRLASASPACSSPKTTMAAECRAPLSRQVKDEFVEEDEDSKFGTNGEQTIVTVIEETEMNLLRCDLCGALTDLPEIYWSSSDVPFECNSCLRLNHDRSHAHSDRGCAACSSLDEMLKERLIIEESFRNGTLAIEELEVTDM